MSDREFERRRMRVYIAGPISKGDVWENIQEGMRWGRQMLTDGLAPYIPHLDAYLTLAPGQPPEGVDTKWNSLLEWDLEWVSVSDAIFRIKGESKGADLEVEVARRLNIPVFLEGHVGSAHWRDYKKLCPAYKQLLSFAESQNLTGVRK